MAKKKSKQESNPNEDLVGRKFYWSEPWEWDVKSVHDDGETAWVHIDRGRDFEMEFPISIIRSNLIYDEEKDG